MTVLRDSPSPLPLRYNVYIDIKRAWKHNIGILYNEMNAIVKAVVHDCTI